MKEVKITHYHPDGSETTVPISGNTTHELNTNINTFLKNMNWDKKYTDVTAERDEKKRKMVFKIII